MNIKNIQLNENLIKKVTNNQYIKLFFYTGFITLTSCGGGGGGGGSNAPTQPQNVIAAAGDAQVRISWDDVSTATAYDICTATETIAQAENCSSHVGGTLSIDQTSPALITGLDNSTT